MAMNESVSEYITAIEQGIAAFNKSCHPSCVGSPSPATAFNQCSARTASNAEVPTTESPSEAWRSDIFTSPPRIDIKKTAKSTTRYQVPIGWSGDVGYTNGGHERVAALLLEQLWLDGYVLRWKPQPLNLKELGGPDATPDFMVELFDKSIHLLEIKAKRFMSPEVTATFDVARTFCEAKFIRHHIWTNHDVLSSQASHTVAELDRGRRLGVAKGRIAEIQAAALNCGYLRELLQQFGWDDVFASAAFRAFHIDYLQAIHENTIILHSPASHYISRLFANRNASGSWWNTLSAR